MKCAILGVILVLAVVGGSWAQDTCSSSLSSLNVCTPFVVPGATAANPNADCCGALQAVNHDCLCSTLRIASRIPAQCNLPPLSCPN
ncbi:stamen-specific protein FIL1-like [Salvia miltiorrhiza]|uniref:stamen-specific protein FIL1-like n=1 Tax=Salvia miltiorrhiza TaxID=226208 RepID=UPI0025ACE200|nr:stamen-specific protein FIL1-like [Salvia miltiorrhiza]